MKKMILVTMAVCAVLFAACGNQTDIGAERAKELALANAGLDSASVTFVKAEAEREDGRKIYDVEFYTKDFTEYDYEIDASTGEILSIDADAEDYTPSSQSNTTTQNTQTSSDATPSQTITEAEAKQIALARVPGAAESDIRDFGIDRDNGRTRYEGKIYYNNTEYEFEIDASNGEVIKWETDPIND